MKQFGLLKSGLVRKGKEYEAVYRKGKRLRGNGFTLIVLGNTLRHNRLGISIHRRMKGAVKRNRLKRIIRESFRLSRQVYPPNADIVVTVRPGFSLKTPAEISKSVGLLTGRPKSAEACEGSGRE